MIIVNSNFFCQSKVTYECFAIIRFENLKWIDSAWTTINLLKHYHESICILCKINQHIILDSWCSWLIIVIMLFILPCSILDVKWLFVLSLEFSLYLNAVAILHEFKHSVNSWFWTLVLLSFNPHETARYGEVASAILKFFVCCMEMG